MALQAKQLQTELAKVTRDIRTRPQPVWADEASRDMASRAGAVTVRKMVETTKMLLQGLEGALILRAGFVAGCFHTWRTEVILARVGQQHREVLEQHHDQWAAHFAHHQQSFEESLRAAGQTVMSLKEKRQQQVALLMDQWAHGDKTGLKRQSLRCWQHYAQKAKFAKRFAVRIHTVLFGWIEGKTRGMTHAGFLSWRHLTVDQREVRKKEAEIAKVHASYQSQMKDLHGQREKELAAKLKEIESRNKDKFHAVESVMMQWEKGKAKGSLAMVMKSWVADFKECRKKSKRRAAVDVQLAKWMEGDRRGSMHATFSRWHSEAKQSAIKNHHDKTRMVEIDRLTTAHQAELKSMQDEMKKCTLEIDKHRSASSRLVQYTLARWDLGDEKGLISSVVRSWKQTAQEGKKAARGRQNVALALAKALEGESRAIMQTSFISWKAIAASEKAVRTQDSKLSSLEKSWGNFMQETQADHEKRLNESQALLAALQSKEHQVTELMIKKWMGGDKAGLVSACFLDWKKVLEAEKELDEKRQAVKDAVLTFIEGDQRGSMVSCLLSWKTFVRLEAEHGRAHQVSAAQNTQLQKQVEQLLANRRAQLMKYAETLGAKQGPVLKNMCFNVWKEESRGAVAGLEAQREKEVLLQEMERQKQMTETRRKERQAQVLDAMGCKRTRVVCIEFFDAWSLIWQKGRDERINRLNHNEAMLKYSEFIISSKLKKDNADIVANTFSEWHREGRILGHQRDLEDTEKRLQDVFAYAGQLERQRVDLQEQLLMYQQQIDMITETLQKELKTKEELATELRTAYDKMRKQSNTPITVDLTDRGWLQGTSDHLDHLVTPRSKTRPSMISSAGAAPSTAPTLGKLGGRLSGTGPPLPDAPTLPIPRSRRSSAQDRELSPTQCDWDMAILRMGQSPIDMPRLSEWARKA